MGEFRGHRLSTLTGVPPSRRAWQRRSCPNCQIPSSGCARPLHPSPRVSKKVQVARLVAEKVACALTTSIRPVLFSN